MIERRGTVRIGVAMTAVVIVGSTAYALATWDEPHRPLILCLLAVGVAGAFPLPFLPLDRILSGRWCEPFFLAWSFLDVCLISGLAAADGGTASPYTALFALTLVFASLSYPMRSFLPVVFLTMLGYGIVAVAAGGESLERDLFFAFVLASVAGLSAWQVHDQAARRREIADVSRALDESERAAGSILETAYEAYIAIDAEGMITNWNRRAEVLFGWKREEAIGRSLAETIIPEQYRAAHRRGLERFLATGDGPLLGKRIVMTALRPDGSDFPVELSITPVRVGDRHTFHAFLDDITERRVSEQALRESEDRFRTLVQGATDYALLGLDLGGRIESWNEGAERMFGYSAREIVGESATRLLPEDDRSGLPAVLWEAEKQGRAEVEGWRLRADGNRFLANAIVTPVHARSGKLLGFVEVARDITEQREAEDALREAEERFRSAFEAAPVGIALVDLSPDSSGGLQQVNAALTEISGRTTTELLETTLEEITDPEDVDAVRGLLAALLEGGARHHSIEARLVRPEGEKVWTSLSASVVRNREGVALYAVVQVQDVGERKRFEHQLQYLADHDPLTGMLNRRRFEQELRKQVALAARYGSGGAVLVVDLDNFKYVNDTLGHAIGDELITRVGTVVRKRLRSTDTVARLGGDEFAALLPETDAAQAVQVAEALREEIRSEPVVGGTSSMRLTASIGISRFGDGAKAGGGDAVLVNADIAMYEAKAAGRDRVELLEAEGPKTKMRARLTWSERIRDALEQDRLTLFQQPILDLETNAINRHELLLRMVGDDGDLIAPTSFLYIAEQFGLIGDIDRWVCGRALELLGDRQQEGNRDLVLEVNLSGLSITDPVLTDYLEAAVRNSGVDASRLVFEVTETAAIVNIDKARQFAARMARLGCSFALDDFGSGFGSFYYLKHLPFDLLKIDGDFIRKLPVSKPDRLTVEAIVQIARGMGKRTIAEFVGDDATLEILRDYGVDFAQGYHVGRPVPILETWQPSARKA